MAEPISAAVVQASASEAGFLPLRTYVLPRLAWTFRLALIVFLALSTACGGGGGSGSGSGGDHVPVTITLNATALGGYWVDLSWTPDSGATEYSVYMDGSYLGPASQNTTRLQFGPLAPNSRHCFVIYVKSLGFIIGKSKKACVKTTIAGPSPTATTDVSAAFQSPTRVDLTRTATQSDYDFALIDYPGATITTFTGINERGQAVGTASDPGYSQIATFVYDSRKALFIPVTPEAGYGRTEVFGINDSGVLVGDVYSLDSSTQSGFVRSTDGAYTIFSHPGSVVTAARGVNNPGLVTGYADTPTGGVGFIFDPASNTFVDIVPSDFTLAEGINSIGDVVGSASLPPGGAYPGSPRGTYAWLRARSGSVTFFRINGQATRARGITDSGLISGYVNDPVSGHQKGFVTILAAMSSFESVAIPVDRLLEPPGQVNAVAAGISNGGVIAGGTSDDSGAVHGFIATPGTKAPRDD
jgi:hypothetical protein